MHRRFRFQPIVSLALFMLFSLAGSAAAQDKEKKKEVIPPGTAILWREPVDIATRDLYLGAGGEAMKPDLSRVTLIKEEKGGYSTKYRVRDGAGREWSVKVGREAQPETAAVRLMYGVGYFADVDYLVPSVRIEGLNKTLENARFGARPKEIKRIDEWSWEQNPFAGKREFQGLKIMMALLNNWDLKDSNNRILVVRGDGQTELQYIVHDLGATFGKSGGAFWRITRTRNDPSGYEKATFIDGVKNGHVEFHYTGKSSSLFENITVEDALWMGRLLSQLSDRQIEDAFRAANYKPEEVRQLAGALRDRIKELEGVSTLTAERQ